MGIVAFCFPCCMLSLGPSSHTYRGIPWWLGSKVYACSVGDPGSIPGSGRSPGDGNGNPLQYSCLENPVDRGAWRATVHGVAESDMTEQLTPFYILRTFTWLHWGQFK